MSFKFFESLEGIDEPIYVDSSIPSKRWKVAEGRCFASKPKPWQEEETCLDLAPRLQEAQL